MVALQLETRWQQRGVHCRKRLQRGVHVRGLRGMGKCLKEGTGEPLI
jgi:hypothetical protein